MGAGPTQALRVELTPLEQGVLTLRLVGPGGVGVAGQVRRGAGAPEAVAVGGLRWELPEGPVDLRVSAPGFRGRDLHAEVPPRGQVDLVVELQPTGAALNGRLVETRQEVRFALDSDRLLDEADAPLQDVLALLQENLDIKLLRIEGHADEQADSAYLNGIAGIGVKASASSRTSPQLSVSRRPSQLGATRRPRQLS